MEELTCPIMPRMPIRSSIASHKSWVGMIGEILNSTMLEWMSLQEAKSPGERRNHDRVR